MWRQAYLTHCALCHQEDGAGMELLAAPLRDSEWVLGDQEPLISIILDGFQGDMLMPPMGTIDDRELADILTYIRSAWGHDASPVSDERVRQVRERSENRTEPWTSEELSDTTE
jgi:mono/diheme cytochrome c family protein